jgi:hypothetical protein
MLRTAAWPCCLGEKRRWGGRGGGVTLRTWTNVDSDDDLRHHRLDDVARQRTCQVVALSCRPSSVGLVTWRCWDAQWWWAPVEQRLREVAVVVGGWLLRMVVVVENENVVS